MRNYKRLILTALVLIFGILFNINVNASESSYYVLTNENSYTMNEASKMLVEDDHYTYTLEAKNSNLQMYVSDGVDNYKTLGLNKGKSFLIKEKGKYKITFNLNTPDSYVSIEREKDKDIYIMGINGYELDSLNKFSNDNGIYSYSLASLGYTTFYLTDGVNNYYNTDGSDYVIAGEGKYKLTFKLLEDSHSLNIEKIEDVAPSYYLKSSHNDYSELELKRNDSDSSYFYYLYLTEPCQFYVIDNNDNIYRNNKLNYIISEMGAYKISFSTEKIYDNSNVKIEALKYNILSNVNDFNYTSKDELIINSDNLSYLEYELDIVVNEPLQFIIADGENEYYNSNGNYLINDNGRYNIKFSPSHKYDDGSNVLISKINEPREEYYILGNFNDYKASKDYLMKFDNSVDSYNQFKIKLRLNSNDSFYIKGKDKNYYSPSGEEIIIDRPGIYDILFSKDNDYGNGYNIYYSLAKDEASNERTIEIRAKDDLLSLIDGCSIDSYSEMLTVELLSDIDMGGATIDPILVFSGIFNGNYHKIYNFTLNTKILGNELGFIRRVLNTASINNLILDYDITIDRVDTSIGGIAGVNYGTINGCVFNGTIKGRSMVSGIAGINEKGGIINRSEARGTIIGNSFVGGITGLNKGEIKGSINLATINNVNFSSADERRLINIGGIAAFNNGLISDSINKGVVGANRLGSFIGGIAGSSIGGIKDSYNTGSISGKNYIGGICGYYSELKNDIELDDYEGILQEIEDILKGHDSNLPEVDTGGRGYKAEIIYTFNEGDVKAEGRAGGICGYASSAKEILKDSFSISYSYNKGNIKSQYGYSGGIVGEHNFGSISDSYNIGIIDGGSGSYAGGIAGSSMGLIAYSFSISAISANDYIGGIAGFGNKVNNTYAIPSLYDADAHIGSILGDVNNGFDNINNNFYVNSKYKGIDNIDYNLKASGISRESLASKGIMNIDLDFNHFMGGKDQLAYPIIRGFVSNIDSSINELLERDILDATAYMCTITFVDDEGEIIATHKLEYGSDFDMSMLPDIPDKEGYFKRFPKDFDGKNITDDLVIMAQYDEIIRSLASDNTLKPKVILMGEFYSTTKMDLVAVDKSYIDKENKYKTVASYKIELKDSLNPVYNGKLEVSYKIDDKENLRVATMVNGTLVLISSRVSDGYLKFSLEDSTEFFILEEEYYNLTNPSFIKAIVYTSLGVVVASGVAITLGCYFGLRGKRKKENND